MEKRKKTIYEISERDGKWWARPIEAPRSEPWRPAGRTRRAAVEEIRGDGDGVTVRRSGL